MMAAQLPRYYAILDDADITTPLLCKLQKMLDRGIKLIQIRLKITPVDIIKIFVEQAYPLCKYYDAWLLINSAVEEAEKIAADGIHLTSSHLMALVKPLELPNASGQRKQWVAASCHNLEELQQAQRMNVDFVVLAPVLPTKTHPEAESLGWQQFTQLVSKVNLPVYALGGLSEADLITAIQAGAQGIGAIRAFSD
jgi:8-oxo-dGTP diphosphatase